MEQPRQEQRLLESHTLQAKEGAGNTDDGPWGKEVMQNQHMFCRIFPCLFITKNIFKNQMKKVFYKNVIILQPVECVLTLRIYMRVLERYKQQNGE